jgi:hypothetical protein
MPHGHAYAAPVPARVTTCGEMSREASWSLVLCHVLIACFVILHAKVLCNATLVSGAV